MQIIELYSDPDYVTNVVLDDVMYFLRLSWNTEGRFWTMQIQDYSRAPLLTIRLQTNIPLLARYAVDGLPSGEFVVISKSTDISQYDFADNYARLVYVSEAELP
jgi:hypothetical protein